MVFTIAHYAKVGAEEGEDLPATPPITPITPSSEGHSTGGVVAEKDDLTYKLTFNAHPSPVKGKVNYSDSDNKKFWGNVDVCYFQSGNQAVFGGTITKGNVAEGYFTVQVQDNGEGKHSTPDKLAVTLSNSLPTCSLGTLDAEVTKGNLQVHEH